MKHQQSFQTSGKVIVFPLGSLGVNIYGNTINKNFLLERRLHQNMALLFCVGQVEGLFFIFYYLALRGTAVLQECASVDLERRKVNESLK